MWVILCPFCKALLFTQNWFPCLAQDSQDVRVLEDSNHSTENVKPQITRSRKKRTNWNPQVVQSCSSFKSSTLHLNQKYNRTPPSFDSLPLLPTKCQRVLQCGTGKEEARQDHSLSPSFSLTNGEFVAAHAWQQKRRSPPNQSKLRDSGSSVKSSSHIKTKGTICQHDAGEEGWHQHRRSEHRQCYVENQCPDTDKVILTQSDWKS